MIRMATQQKQKLFVYGRKEVLVLAGLGVWVAAFAFTLGVHLGKRVVPKAPSPPGAEPTSASTLEDAAPNRQEIQEQAHALTEGIDETVAQELQEEVQREGLKLNKSRQVLLPGQAKSANGGATTLKAVHGKGGHAAASGAVFTLQVGSFPTLAEAEAEMKALETRGMKPFLKPSEVKGKTWHRVYVGGYDTREQAQTAGKNYQEKQWIKSFIVAKARD